MAFTTASGRDTEFPRLNITTDTNATAARIAHEPAKLRASIFLRKEAANSWKAMRHDDRVVQAGKSIMQQGLHGNEYEDVVRHAFAIETKLQASKASVDALNSLAHETQMDVVLTAWCGALTAINYTADSAMVFLEKYGGIKGGMAAYSKSLSGELSAFVGWTETERGRVLRRCGERPEYENALFMIFRDAIGFEPAKSKASQVDGLSKEDRPGNRELIINTWMAVRDSADAAAAFLEQNGGVKAYSKALFDVIVTTTEWLRGEEARLSHTIDITERPKPIPLTLEQLREFRRETSWRQHDTFARERRGFDVETGFDRDGNWGRGSGHGFGPGGDLIQRNFERQMADNQRREREMY
jgi:hypothetical protein